MDAQRSNVMALPIDTSSLEFDSSEFDPPKRDVVAWLSLGFAVAVLGSVVTLVSLTIANKP